jgi:hypothetical protein
MCRRDVEMGKRRFVDPAAGDVEPLPLFPHVPESGELEASLILLLFPNLLIAAVLDHVTVSIIVPERVDRTRFRRRFRLVGKAASDPAYAASRQRLLESWTRVTNQDGPIWAAVQSNMGARGEAGFRPCFSAYWEAAVHDFQRMVARQMLGASP